MATEITRPGTERLRMRLAAPIIGMILTAAALAASGDLRRTRAARIELNTWYDEKGKPSFDQYIFWEYDREDGMYHVIDWCRPKGASHRRLEGGGHLVSFLIRGRGRSRHEVYSRCFVRTHTHWDPEIQDRQHLPEESRSGLWGEPRKHKWWVAIGRRTKCFE
jgi:hypothetical protein